MAISKKQADEILIVTERRVEMNLESLIDDAIMRQKGRPITISMVYLKPYDSIASWEEVLAKVVKLYEALGWEVKVGIYPSGGEYLSLS